MRVADYMFKTLADNGIKHAFLVVGGGAMQLNDALRLETRITPVCCHHEQACAIAAEGYYRASGKMPVVSVTTGPGGVNALTGVIGSWLDSIPMLVISGQVKFRTTIASCPELKLRQLGDQEINIVDMVRPVTKYAAMVTDPAKIPDELQKALRLAREGRPGPVWLDIPLDVQGALLPEGTPGFILAKDEPPSSGFRLPESFRALLAASRRPVIIAGHGVELDGAEEALRALVEAKQIPVLSTFCGMNVLPSIHPLSFGRIGTIGQRAANFILQNADLVVSIGSRNNIRQISYNWENFAKTARKVVIDIDPEELKKPTLRPDLPVCERAGVFISAWLKDTQDCARPAWLDWCRGMRAKYPVHTDDQRVCAGGVNPYHMTAVMSGCCPPDVNVGIGNGTVSIAAFQTWQTKPGQKIAVNSGCASMGYDLPVSLGMAVSNDRLTICLAGDGSLMMNLQELATVIYRRLPMKIFLFDNGGYTSIRQTQGNLFSPRFIGCDARSGVGFPDFKRLVAAFGYPVTVIESHDGLQTAVERILSTREPEFVVVRIPPELGFSPKLSARRLPDGTMVSPTLEDMYPFLDRREMAENVCRV